jgi:hypothetical protein
MWRNHQGMPVLHWQEGVARGGTYCFHFLDLLGEMSQRYRVEIHAYVLMDDHSCPDGLQEGNLHETID